MRPPSPARRGAGRASLSWAGALRLIFSAPAAILLALGVVGAYVFPWHVAPAQRYPALDPNLTFISARQSGLGSGHISLHGADATIQAAGGSSPRVDLVDSESDFTTNFTVTPTVTAPAWRLASVTVAAPKEARYFDVLIGAVGGTMLFRDVRVSAGSADGGAGVPFADDFTDPQLPKWEPAQGVSRTYQLGAYALMVSSSGQQAAGTYTPVPTPIEPDSKVTISAHVHSTTGNPTFKVAIGWLDSQRRLISYRPDWSAWSSASLPIVAASISLWYPRLGNSIALQFLPGGEHAVVIAVHDSQRGDITRRLAGATPGETYHVAVVWRHGHSLSFTVTSPDGALVSYQAGTDGGLALFRDPFVNLSIGSSAPVGSDASAELGQVRLVIPSRTRFSAVVSDWRLSAFAALVLVWVLGFLLRGGIAHRTRAGRMGLLARPALAKGLIATTAVAAIAAGTYLLLAANTDGHPFDRLTQESGMYVAAHYGLAAVYNRSTAIPDAVVRGRTVPWSPAEFVYPPGMAEFLSALGIVWTHVRGSIQPLADASFQAFWKLALSLFLLIDGVVLLAIVRRLAKSPRRWDVVIFTLTVLNPALLFDGPVWGQTNALLLLPLLLALLALIAERPRAMWCFLAVAVLLKQTALLPAAPIAVFALRRFGLRRNGAGAAVALVLGFALTAPAAWAGLHPDTSLLTTVGKLVDFGSPSSTYTTVISEDTFPIWVLFSGFTGLSGHDRLWGSDEVHLGTLPLTYSDAGLLLFLVTAAVACWVAWRAAHPSRSDHVRLALAIGLVILAYVTLTTRSSGHYLTLAIPFLLVGLPRARGLAIRTVAVATAIALISEYGLFMFIAQRGEWPNFGWLGSPAASAVGSDIYRIYASDVFVTLFAAVLLVATAWLALDLVVGWSKVAGAPAHLSPDRGRVFALPPGLTRAAHSERR